MEAIIVNHDVNETDEMEEDVRKLCQKHKFDGFIFIGTKDNETKVRTAIDSKYAIPTLEHLLNAFEKDMNDSKVPH